MLLKSTHMTSRSVPTRLVLAGGCLLAAVLAAHSQVGRPELGRDEREEKFELGSIRGRVLLPLAGASTPLALALHIRQWPR